MEGGCKRGRLLQRSAEQLCHASYVVCGLLGYRYIEGGVACRYAY